MLLGVLVEARDWVRTDCFFHHPRFPTVPTMYGDAGIFFFSMKAVNVSADMLRQAWNWAILSNSATQTNTVNQALGTQSSPDGKAIKTVSTIEREQLEVDFAKRVLWDLINRGRHVDASWIIFWSRSHGSCRNFETLGIYQIYPNLHWQEKLTQMATIAFLRRRTSWCVINW